MKKRWIAILCALALTFGLAPGASAAGKASGTGSFTTGSEWNGTDLYASEGTEQIKVIVQCNSGKMDVELIDGQGKFLKKQTLDASSSDSSLVYYIKRTDNQYGNYHLKWRGVNGQMATGTYYWAAVGTGNDQSQWESVFGRQPWSTNGAVTVLNSLGEKEPLPLYSSLYPNNLREITGALSDPDTYEGENGALASIAFRRDLDITPLTYGQMPTMFYRFNANGKKVLIRVNGVSGSLAGCDLLVKNETTGQFLAWVPGMTAGGGGVLLPTEYGVRYGIYAASGSDALGAVQLSITDDLPDNTAPDNTHVANPRQRAGFNATASWDGQGLQVGENVEIFRLVVECDTGSMTVRVVDDDNHLVMPTQFLTADSDSEAASFNFIIHRAEGYTGSYAIWWIGADGQGGTGSYSWAPVKEGGFEPGVDGQLPAPTVTEGENSFRWPYQNIELHGGGGDYAGCAYSFKLENNENYFRVAVRNDLAPEIGNITVGVYAEGDHLPYVSYTARPGAWTEPFVFRGVPGMTYKVVLSKSAATPELVEGLLSIKCAPNPFE